MSISRRSSFGPSTADDAIEKLEQYTTIISNLENELEVAISQRDKAQRERESFRKQAIAQVKSLQETISSKDKTLHELRAKSDTEQSKLEASAPSDLARALARIQELEDRQKLQAKAYRKQRGELMRLRLSSEKNSEISDRQKQMVTDAQERLQKLQDAMDAERATAEQQLEEKTAQLEALQSDLDAQKEATEIVKKELDKTKLELAHITNEQTRIQVDIEKERRNRHELVNKVQQDAASQRQKLARRITKLSADVDARNAELLEEKQKSARANTEMVKLLASLEASEAKFQAESEARAKEREEHMKTISQLEQKHRDHADHLRRASDNREAALLSHGQYEQEQVAALALSVHERGSIQLKYESSTNMSSHQNEIASFDSSKSTQLTLPALAQGKQFESILASMQEKMASLEELNTKKEAELEKVRRQHENQMSKVREKTESRIEELMKKLEERHKASQAENLIFGGEERKGEGRGKSVDKESDLRKKYHQTLHELSICRAGSERLLAERASFASQIASMDAQLKAMQSLVKQLERARDATANQHKKERSLLENQIVRLVQGVQKCREQLIKRRDQVKRLKLTFSKLCDHMVRQSGGAGVNRNSNGNLLLLRNQFAPSVLQNAEASYNGQAVAQGMLSHAPTSTPDGLSWTRALPSSPSGLYYNPMSLQQPKSGGMPSSSTRSYEYSHRQKTNSNESNSFHGNASTRTKTHRERRKRLRTRALLTPLLKTVQDLWAQVSASSFEVMMHNSACKGMRPADVLTLSSKRLSNIERCVHSLLIARKDFSNQPASKVRMPSPASNGIKGSSPTKVVSDESTWDTSSLLGLLPLSGRRGMYSPSRSLSPARSSSPMIPARRGTLERASEDFVVPLFEQLVGQVYLFASEVVTLRRRVNDYTEALLSTAWEKEERFKREFASTETNSGDLNMNHEPFFSDKSPASGFIIGEDDEDGEDGQVDQHDGSRVGEYEHDDEDNKKSALDKGDISMPINHREGKNVALIHANDDSRDTFMSDDAAEAILTKLQNDASVQGIGRKLIIEEH